MDKDPHIAPSKIPKQLQFTHDGAPIRPGPALGKGLPTGLAAGDDPAGSLGHAVSGRCCSDQRAASPSGHGISQQDRHQTQTDFLRVVVNDVTVPWEPGLENALSHIDITLIAGQTHNRFIGYGRRSEVQRSGCSSTPDHQVVRGAARALGRPLRLNVRDDGELSKGRDVVDDADPVDVVDVVAQQGAGHRLPGRAGTLIATIARSRLCVSLAVSFASWLSAGSTRTTWDRRGACSGDTGLLTGEALQVRVAGFLPQHARLPSQVAAGGDVLQHRGKDVDPRALIGRVRANGRCGVLIKGLAVGCKGRLLAHPGLLGFSRTCATIRSARPGHRTPVQTNQATAKLPSQL